MSEPKIMMTEVTIKNKDLIINHAKTIEVNGERMAWYELNIIPSTMDFAKDLIIPSGRSFNKNFRMVWKGCSPWTLVTAEQQSSGRGTHGRNWISPPGKGLLLSLILPNPRNIGCIEDLSVHTAGVLVKTLRDFYELPYEIKHPNDILIGGRKVAGIMFESVTRGEKVLSLILGMGLNLYQSEEDFKHAGLHDATSFLIETGRVLERKSLLNSFLKHFKLTFASGQ